MKRLYALDALRGLAALSVVVWHWQHFYALTGVWQEGWQRADQPFFWALKPLYDAGWAAVDLFFALSGFVFFWLYGDRIASRALTATKFSQLRFSRLYPLYFATLMAAMLLQAVFLGRTGHSFISDPGDWHRLAAALVMAQQWLPPSEGQYFNGPAWSVSVEVLLYILFFAFCRLGLMRPLWMLMVAVLAVALVPWNEFIARGLEGFFLGGVVWFMTEQVKRRPDAARIARLLGWVALAVWAVTIGEDYSGFLHARLKLEPFIAYFGDSDEVWLLPFIFIVSPLTLAALALQEQLLGRRYQKLAFLGDISYSTYLLHFPLQLLCVLAALRFGWGPAAFMTPFAMIAFFAVLIVLGAASHYGFERPLQAIIRGDMRRRTATA